MKTRRLFYIILPLTLLAYAAFIFFYKDYDIEREKRDLHEYGRAVASSLWSLDPRGPTEYLTLLCSLNGYSRLTVKENNGRVFLSVGAEPVGLLKSHLIDWGLIEPVALTADVVYNKQSLGRISAVWYPDSLFFYFDILLIISLALVCLRLFFTILDVNQELEARVRNRTSDLNRMNQELRGEVRARLSAEEEIKTARENLEIRVEERTEELYLANKRLMEEVTERRTAEEALRESERQYRGVLQTIPDLFYRADLKGVLLMTNEEGVKRLGYESAEDVIGKGLAETFYYNPEDRQAFIKAISQTGEVKDFPITLKTRQGLPMPVEVNSHFYYNEKGDLAGIEGMARDISQRKQVEQILKIQLELGTRLGGASDLDSALKLVLEAACQVEGVDGGAAYLEDEENGGFALICQHGLSNRYIAKNSYIDPDVLNDILIDGTKSICFNKREFDSYFESGGVEEDLKSGMFIPLHYHGRTTAALYVISKTYEEFPVFTGNGLESMGPQAEGVIARLKAEEERKKNEELLGHVADGLPVLMAYADSLGRLRYVNKNHERFFGKSRQEILGRTEMELLDEKSREIAGTHIQNALKGRESSYEIKLTSSQDGPRIFFCRVYPNFSTEGRVLGYFQLAEDITAKKIAEEELNRYRKDLEGLVRERTMELENLNLELQNVFNISRAAQASENLDDYYRETHEYLKEIIEADSFFIGVFDHGDDRMIFPYYVDKLNNPLVSLDPDDAEHPAALIAAAGKPVISNFFESDEPPAGEEPGTSLGGSWLGAPLKVRSGLIGVIGVQTHKKDFQYTQDDLQLLESVSNLIALAIDRKKAEESLKASEEKYRNIVETAHEGIWILDDESRFAFINKRFSDMLGIPADEIVGRQFSTFIDIEDGDFFEDKIANRRHGIKEEYEARLIGGDGREIWGIISATPFLDNQGRFAGSLAMFADITDRKKAEKDLRNSREELKLQNDFFQRAIEALTHPFYIIDVNTYRIVMANSATGKAAQTGSLPCYEAIHGFEAPCSQCPLDAVRQTGRPMEMEVQHEAHNGRKKVLRVHAYPVLDRDDDHLVQVILYTIDITEQKLLEEQLRQTQKMEAIGALAGGIAHDFNNILSAILGNAQLLSLELPDDNPKYYYVDQIVSAGKRARDLVSQILKFSRKSEEQRNPIEVAVFIKETLKMFRTTFPTTIEIRSEINSESYMVMADPTQLQQILMNLCANASYAMQDQGGVLTVALNKVEINEADSPALGGAAPGDYLKLSVSDTGPGIPPELVSRIFEPFFTTKKAGEGTGMGLALVYGIVKSYGGGISLDNNPGRGACFNVFLPVYLEDEAQEPTFTEPRGLPLGAEKILLVDDEQALIKVGSSLLTKLGYEVTAEQSSLDALEIFSKNPDYFDLVITDQTMPKMTGLELSARITALRPDIPVILCTGFSNRVTHSSLMENNITKLLLKPLSIELLARSIREALAEKQEMNGGPTARQTE